MRTRTKTLSTLLLLLASSCGGEEAQLPAPELIQGDLIDAGPATEKAQAKSASSPASGETRALLSPVQSAEASGLGYGAIRQTEGTFDLGAMGEAQSGTQASPAFNPLAGPDLGPVYNRNLESVDEATTGNLEAGESTDLRTKSLLKFSDLALGEEAVDQLLDSLMAIDDFPSEPFEFPERIRQLDGEEVALLGYMIPTRWENAKVQSFMLVGDMLSCCFGGSPQADQWIDVSVAGEGTKYLPYIPVIVKGSFQITSEMPESGYFIGVYQMEASSVKAKD